MTTISDLSWDLVEKILSRVPITSIGAVGSTCKLWNRLCKNRIWRNLEAKRHQFLGFMVKNYKLCLIRFNLHGILDEEEFVDPTIKEIIGDSLLNQVDVTKVFHCDGLLLCVTKDKEEEEEEEVDRRTSLVVWNPYLGQIRWIQRPRRNNYHRLDRYALGYDGNKKNRKHKILRFLDDDKVSAYEIYDFSSDSWSILNITPDYDIMFFQRGVSLKGNAYFFATEKLQQVVTEEEEEYTPEPHQFLICFDFTIERFGPSLPLPFNHYTSDTGTLSSLRDEKLAALYQCCDMAEVEVWVTTKIDEEPNAVSWIPFLRFDLEPFTGFDLQFQHDGASFFIDEEKKIAVVFHLDSSDQMTYSDDTYDDDDFIGENEVTCNDTAYIIGENGYFRKVGLGEGVKYPSPLNLGEYCPLVCSSSYVPSLVHINWPIYRRQQLTTKEKAKE